MFWVCLIQIFANILLQYVTAWCQMTYKGTVIYTMVWAGHNDSIYFVIVENCITQNCGHTNPNYNTE